MGACLVLALLCAALGVHGLLHARGPVRRYVRLLVFAIVLMALPLALVIVGQVEHL
jgi:NADH:ubiquinone oxidoreductase subunit K